MSAHPDFAPRGYNYPYFSGCQESRTGLDGFRGDRANLASTHLILGLCGSVPALGLNISVFKIK